MQNYQINRRQALLAAGMGTAALGMPGAVMGTDRRDDSGTPVHSEKSCIFVLLCGGCLLYTSPSPRDS